MVGTRNQTSLDLWITSVIQWTTNVVQADAMSIEITEAERRIMKVLWNDRPLRSGEIVQKVADDRHWHSKTVNTLIRRLVDKGAVGFERKTGGFLYFPLIAREDYRRDETKRFVSDLFDGEITPLLACFAKSEALTEPDLQELRKLIAKLEK